MVNSLKLFLLIKRKITIFHFRHSPSQIQTNVKTLQRKKGPDSIGRHNCLFLPNTGLSLNWIMSRISKPLITSILEWSSPSNQSWITGYAFTQHLSVRKLKPRNLRDFPKNSKQLKRFLLSFFYLMQVTSDPPSSYEIPQHSIASVALVHMCSCFMA